MRVFFATDIHGSEVCWRKFLNAGKFHKADVLIMGGDMTGKAMVPIVSNGSSWELELQGQKHVLTTEDEVQAMEKRISDRGYYPVRLSRDEVDAWAADPALVDERFKAEMLGNVERWMALGDERLAGTGIRCIVSPANDDIFELDPIIEHAQHLELGEANLIALDGFTLISTGYANPTPWNTFRSCPSRAARADRRAGRPGARPEAGDLQLPCAALRLEPGQRAEARREPQLRLGRAGADPGGLEGGPRIDPGLRPAAVAARPHPRGQGSREARQDPGGEPRQLLRGRHPAGGDRRSRCEERRGEALSADQRLTVNG
jgi:Icc-related predicted phosphoesterase